MPTKRLVGAAAIVAGVAGGAVVGAMVGAPATSSAASGVAEVAEVAEVAFHGGGPGGRFGFGLGLETAAEVIGISEDELRDALAEGQTLAEVAQANDVDPQAVIDALVAEATARIDEAVADGDLDAERAEELKANVTERVTDAVNGEGGFRFGPGRGHHFRGIGLDVAAETIGISEDDLRAALQDGQTVAEVAEANGVDPQAVIDALVAEATENLTERITDFVNGDT